jgi:ketosteroid isomerase-like protein
VAAGARDASTDCMSSEAEIKKVFEGAIRAIHARNLEKSIADYADDVVRFDVGAPPIAQAGKREVAKRNKEWFDGWSTSIEIEVRDLVITASETVGFVRSLQHVSGTTKAGTKVNMWVRWTGGFEKRGGVWKIVHEHVSSPIDFATMTAKLDAAP